ncbi:MAG: cytochrome c oxidase subunit 3, partial [Bacteroidota bacterium]
VPTIYKTSTWFIILSSIFVVISQTNIKSDEIERAFRFTAFGLTCGLIFSVMQVIGWKELLDSNTSFRNILFPFSLIHFLHIGVGIALLIAVFSKIRKYKVHSRARQFAYNVFMFWHFLGVVWVLFILFT